MGFCVYWNPVPTDAETLSRFAADLRRVVQHSSVREGDGRVAIDFNERYYETFSVSLTPARYNGSCKTKRTPFTEDVMAACILMVYHKIATDYSNDDEEEFPWEPVFVRVASVLGWGPATSFHELEMNGLKRRIDILETRLEIARQLMGKLESVLNGGAL